MALPCSHGIARHHFSCFFSSFHSRSVYIGGLATIILACRHCLIVLSNNREFNRNISHFTRGANTDFQLAFESREMHNVNFLNYRIYFICIISDVILSNAIAYQVERHDSLQMRTCRLD
jgi:hypothetical protein